MWREKAATVWSTGASGFQPGSGIEVIAACSRACGDPGLQKQSCEKAVGGWMDGVCGVRAATPAEAGCEAEAQGSTVKSMAKNSVGTLPRASIIYNLLNPFQIVSRRLTFLISSLTTRLIQSFIQNITFFCYVLVY